MTGAAGPGFPHNKPYIHQAYVADDSGEEDDLVHDVRVSSGRRTPTRRHSVSRGRHRGGVQYIQTGSDRRLHVPLSARPRSRSRRRSSKSPFRAPTAAAADPLTQVREAYLAGHADRDRLLSAQRLSTSRSGVHSADGVDLDYALPRKYHATSSRRPLAHSDTLPSMATAARARVFQQEATLPGVRRMSASEGHHRVDRAQGREFDGGVRYEEEDQRSPLEERFARVRIVNSRTVYDDDMDLEELEERRRRRNSRTQEALARDGQEAILRGIGGEGGRRRASFDNRPFIDVPQGRHESRYDARGDVWRGRH